MPSISLLNLLAVSTLAVIAASFGPSPVNAIATEGHNFSRNVAHGHAPLAKKKRTNAKRCKTRTSSLVTSSATAKAKPTTTTKPHTTTAHHTTTSTSHKTTTTSSGGSSNCNDLKIGSCGSGKVGMAWAAETKYLSSFATDKTYYLYNWSPSIDPAVKKHGFNGCPMLWGDKQISKFAELAVEGYANCAMGPNEPNQSGQSNMTPAHGASLWKKYIDPLKNKGYTKLVSPATSSAPSGFTWMQKFFKECDGCKVDVLALHWYATDADEFIKYVTKFYNEFKKPIWVTEYADQNFSGGSQASCSQVTAFHNKVSAWMDSTPWVEAYFPFGAMLEIPDGVNTCNQLMNPNSGKPTTLGYNLIN